MKKTIFIIIITFLFTLNLISNEKQQLKLSLHEAIEQALENNLDIIISNYTLEMAEQSIIKTEASFDPVVSSSASFREDRSDISLGISKRFHAGTNISLEHNINQRDSVIISDDYTSSLSLSIRQPLLKNRGKNVNTAFLKIDYNNLKISELNLKQEVLSIISDIQKIYWDIVYNNELYTVKQQTLKLAEELYENNKTKVELGLLPQIELTRAAAAVAAQQEGIIIAENNINNIQDIYLNRINALQNPYYRNKKIVPIDKPAPIMEVPDFFASMRFCLQNNPDYLKLKKQIENNNIRLEYYKNQNMPSLDFVTTLSANGIDENISSAYGNLASLDKTDWQIGLSFSVPIGRRQSKVDYSNTQLNNLILISNLKKLENNLSLQVQRAIRNIEATIKRIAVAETSIKLAEENLNAEMERFELQQTTTYNVLQYQESLDNERTRLLKAMIDNQVAVIEYETLLGGLLSK